MKEQKDIEEKNSWKKLLSFSIPLTLIGLVEYFLIFTDFLWVKVFLNDSNALAAIRVSTAILSVVEALISGVLAAIIIYIGHNIDNDREKVKIGFKNGISISLYVGLLISILGFLFFPQLSKLFGINSLTEGYTADYLSIYFIGYIFITISSFLIIIPRYFYNLQIILRALLIKVITNAIITPVIIIVFDSIPILSAAALGTIIAHFISLIYLILKIYHLDILNLNFTLKDIPLGFHFSLMKTQAGFMSSQIFNGLTFSLSSFMFLAILSFYPSSVFNIYSIGSYAFLFFGAIGQSYASSLIPIISREYGKGNIEGIQNIVKKSIIILLGFGVIVSTIMMLSSKFIADMLSENATEKELLTKFILIYSIPWVLKLVSVIFIFVAAGSGHASGSFYLIISNMYFIGLLPMLFMPKAFSDITTGVLITLVVIDVITFVNSYLYYLRGGWKRKVSMEKRIQQASEA